MRAIDANKIDELAKRLRHPVFQAVTHLSTDWALRCLTSVIGREPVLST